MGNPYSRPDPGPDQDPEEGQAQPDPVQEPDNNGAPENEEENIVPQVDPDDFDFDLPQNGIVLTVFRQNHDTI